MELPKRVKCKLDATPPPGQIAKGASFTFGGILTETATGLPVAGKPVDLYVNDSYVGSTTTLSDGSWSFPITLTTDGIYSMYADFPGDATHWGCPDV